MQVSKSIVMAHTLVINCRMLQNPDVGLGSYTARLIKGLARHAPEWKLVCLVPENVLFDFPPLCETVVLKPPRIYKLLSNAWFDVMVDRFAEHQYPNGLLFHPMPVAHVARPLMTCMVYHDCIPVYFSVYLGRKVIRRVLSRLCDVAARRCRTIFTVSNHARQDIIKNKDIQPEKIHTVHNWLPPEYNPRNAHYDAARVRQKYSLPSRFWLYIGGYDIRKNVEFLIRAYAQARSLAPCPSLVLAGRIPSTHSIASCDVHNAIVSTGLTNGLDIITPGFIAQEDMLGLYGAAELLIYPSLYEGFGMPPMEAMGCGCPAVSANNTSLPEVIKDSSYRFNAQLPEELINLLIRGASKALPMNPSFAQNEFSEKTALSLLIPRLRIGTHQV